MLRIRPVARIEMQRAQIARTCPSPNPSFFPLALCRILCQSSVRQRRGGAEGAVCGCSRLAIAAVATVVVIARHFGFVLCPVSWGNEQEAATHRHRQTDTLAHRHGQTNTHTQTQVKTHRQSHTEPCRRHAVTLRLATSVYLSLCLSILRSSLICSPSPSPLLGACVDFALCCIFALICSSCFQDALN